MASQNSVLEEVGVGLTKSCKIKHEMLNAINFLYKIKSFKSLNLDSKFMFLLIHE